MFTVAYLKLHLPSVSMSILPLHEALIPHQPIVIPLSCGCLCLFPPSFLGCAIAIATATVHTLRSERRMLPVVASENETCLVPSVLLL